MSMFDLDASGSAIVDSGFQVRTTVIGLVARNDFARARALICEMAGYQDYDDWLDARQGLQIGLSLAGVDTAAVCVSLSSFLEWRDLTGAPSDERALDRFAALALTVRNTPASRALALVGEKDFETHPHEAAAFAGGRGYHGWMRHRRTTRAQAIADGAHVEELPVRLDHFLGWCACLGQSASETALDCYAQLLLEQLTGDLAS